MRPEKHTARSTTTSLWFVCGAKFNIKYQNTVTQAFVSSEVVVKHASDWTKWKGASAGGVSTENLVWESQDQVLKATVSGEMQNKST